MCTVTISDALFLRPLVLAFSFVGLVLEPQRWALPGPIGCTEDGISAARTLEWFWPPLVAQSATKRPKVSLHCFVIAWDAMAMGRNVHSAATFRTPTTMFASIYCTAANLQLRGEVLMWSPLFRMNIRKLQVRETQYPIPLPKHPRLLDPPQPLRCYSHVHTTRTNGPTFPLIWIVTSAASITAIPVDFVSRTCKSTSTVMRACAVFVDLGLQTSRRCAGTW